MRFTFWGVIAPFFALFLVGSLPRTGNIAALTFLLGLITIPWLCFGFLATLVYWIARIVRHS